MLYKSLITAIIVILAATGVLLVVKNRSAQTLPTNQVSIVPAQASLTLTSPINGTVEVGQTQSVSWTSKNYSLPTVAVNLIRKISDNPARYELVRTIAAKKSNDGSATWVPAKKDVGTHVSVEIGCAVSAGACVAGDNVSSGGLAVIDSNRFANTAAAYQAIEQLNNK